MMMVTTTMRETYVGHGLERVECCGVEPCVFHKRFPQAVRSPHIAQDFTMQACVDCRDEIVSQLYEATS